MDNSSKKKDSAELPKVRYLMHPNLFQNLTYVSGFTDCNGKTYQEHIIKIFGGLSEEIKVQISEAEDAGSALKILTQYNILYTHDM